MKQELFSMFTKMEHWKDRGGLLTQAAPTPAGRQAVLRHVKELLTHYTSYAGKSEGRMELRPRSERPRRRRYDLDSRSRAIVRPHRESKARLLRSCRFPAGPIPTLFGHNEYADQR